MPLTSWPSSRQCRQERAAHCTMHLCLQPDPGPPLLLRLRKSWLEGCQFAAIGEPADLTYPVAQLGEGSTALSDLLKADSPVLKKLTEAKRPAVIVGPGILHRDDRGTILQQVCLGQAAVS